MTATLTDGVLTIDTFETAFEDVLEAARVGMDLTPEQVTRMRESITGPVSNLLRIMAEKDAASQELLLKVYNTLSWSATGDALDNVVALLGVTRLAAASSRVAVTVTAANGTEIEAGIRAEYNPTGSTWSVVNTVTVGATGSAELLLEAEDTGAVLVGAVASGDWSLLDSVPGVTLLETDEQTVTGRDRELDGPLRERGAIEAYRRGLGPVAAIEAAVSAVDGVTFVRVFESEAVLATAVDTNGIPARSLNVVVSGGDSDEIAAAIKASRPGGMYLYAEPGAQFVERSVLLSNGWPIRIRFNRVEELEMWIQYTATTSTSETATTPAVITEIDQILEDGAADLFGIGADVLPSKLEALVQSSDVIEGVDDLEVRLSLDDGAADVYTRARRAVSLRQIPTFNAARISGVEA